MLAGDHRGGLPIAASCLKPAGVRHQAAPRSPPVPLPMAHPTARPPRHRGQRAGRHTRSSSRRGLWQRSWAASWPRTGSPSHPPTAGPTSANWKTSGDEPPEMSSASQRAPYASSSPPASPWRTPPPSSAYGGRVRSHLPWRNPGLPSSARPALIPHLAEPPQNRFLVSWSTTPPVRETERLTSAHVGGPPLRGSGPPPASADGRAISRHPGSPCGQPPGGRHSDGR